MKRGAKSWFRVHVSILHSRKVQSLPPALFKWLVNFWSAAAENDGALPSAEDLAWTLHEPIAKVKAAVMELIGKRLLDEIDGVYYPHDWADWQFESDISTERVKRHRERQRNVSPTVSDDVSRNVAETPRARVRAEHIQKQIAETEQNSAPLLHGNDNGFHTSDPRWTAAGFESPEAFEDWYRKLYAEHPQQGDFQLGQDAIRDEIVAGTLTRATFETNYAAHKRSAKWLRENGRSIPKLSTFMQAKSAHFPPAEPPKEGGDEW